MIEKQPSDFADRLQAAGLAVEAVRRWFEAKRSPVNATLATPRDFSVATDATLRYLQLGEALLDGLPPPAARGDRERLAAEMLKDALRDARRAYLEQFAGEVWRVLTADGRSPLRAEELVWRAAERYPGLTPTRAAVRVEAARAQKDKDGVELDQGILLGHMLAHDRAGAQLVHAMLQPTATAQELLPAFQQSGLLDLGTVVVERQGKGGHVWLRNTRYLNAEDDSTTGPLETAVDLVLLDPAIEVGVLRGATVEHPRYRGRRVFNAGINLTHLYHGRISYLFYATRDLGYVNKLYRGLAAGTLRGGGLERTLEKPWIAAVETFAIGGGCQLLLVMDHVLAEADAYCNLPARKEGIIPGAANLRLPRVVGDRLARQGILFDRRFSVDSPEGRLLCDVVVPTGAMQTAIEHAVEQLTSSGVVSAASNRRALRVGQEPLTLFQAYMATYLHEQAYCHFSPALIDNLERHWRAHERRS